MPESSRGEHERRRQIIGSAAQKNVAAFLPFRLLRALQRGEGFFQRAGIRVVARRRNEIRLRAAKHAENTAARRLKNSELHGTDGRGTTGLCLHGGRRRRKPVGAGRQFDFAGIARGLHDDLRQAVEQAARPRRGAGVPDDFHGHVRIQTAGADTIVDAHGDDVVAGVDEFLDVENRLRLPVVRFADKLAVHKIPALVVAAGETNLRAGAFQVFVRQREMRAVNRRGVRCFDGRPAAADGFPRGVVKIIRVFRHGAAVVRNF